MYLVFGGTENLLLKLLVVSLLIHKRQQCVYAMSDRLQLKTWTCV